MDNLAKEYDERAKGAIRWLTGLATILIRVTVILFVVYLIFRIASTVFGFYDAASEPILPRR